MTRRSENFCHNVIYEIAEQFARYRQCARFSARRNKMLINGVIAIIESLTSK